MITNTPYPWLIKPWEQLVTQHQQRRLAHAYLIYGERGIGKREFASGIANFLLCLEPDAGKACRRCRSCHLAATGTQPDLLVIAPEQDSKVIKINQIRELLDFTSRTAHWAARKIVIIERADALHRGAANALLKTLEEPAGNTMLLLLSDNPGRLIPTIRSRCQLLSMPKPDNLIALEWLRTNSSGENMPAVLAAAGGSPLLARDMQDSGTFAQRQALFRILAGICLGKAQALDLVAHCRNLDTVSVIGHLSQASTILTKYIVTMDPALILDTELQLIASHVNSTRSTASRALEQLIDIGDRTEVARRKISSGANPNASLLLQDIARSWSRISGVT